MYVMSTLIQQSMPHQQSKLWIYQKVLPLSLIKVHLNERIRVNSSFHYSITGMNLKAKQLSIDKSFFNITAIMYTTQIMLGV